MKGKITKRRIKNKDELKYIPETILEYTKKKKFEGRIKKTTKKQYKGVAAHYELFCELYKENPTEPKNGFEQRIIKFILWKHLNVGIGWSAMRGHLYAVSNYLKDHKIFIKTSNKDMPTLHGIFEEEKRVRPPGDGAEAIDLEEIMKMIKQIDKDTRWTDLDKKKWKLILGIAFYELKRIGEYNMDTETKKGLEYNRHR